MDDTDEQFHALIQRYRRALQDDAEKSINDMRNGQQSTLFASIAPPMAGIPDALCEAMIEEAKSMAAHLRNFALRYEYSERKDISHWNSDYGFCDTLCFEKN